MRPVGSYLAPERFLAFIVALAIATWLAARQFPRSQAVMIGFDIATLVFLVSIAPLLRHHSAEQMRKIARDNDANRIVLLVVSGAVIGVILVAVGSEVTRRGHLTGWETALVIATLVLAWLFSNTVYALHYAHIFYREDRVSRRDQGGIDFPGKGDPDYADFLYFAFTLGMTFQTSDSGITTRHVRQVAIFHCFLAFVFNIGVLAFTINVLGSAGS